MSDETTLLPCPFCGGEASVQTTYGYGVSEAFCLDCGAHTGYPPGGCTEAEAIAAWNTRVYLNPGSLPMGLTISDDGNLLNWRGENYVRQGTLGNDTLTAEQVCETVEKHWHDLPDEYDIPEATALPEYSYNWQAIADELNAKLGSECDKWKAKAEEAGRAMNAAAGLWAKADAENRELRKMLLLDDGTVEEYTERADPLTALAHQKQLAEEWRDRCHNAEALCDKIEAERDELNAKLGSGTCEVECFDDGVDEGMDGEWFSYAPPTWYLSCGHTAQGTEKPNFCPVCGKAVKR